MAKINKRPIVIQDLINQATFIAQNNLDASDRFLAVAEETFQLLGTMPAIGRLSNFDSAQLANIRQYPIKSFRQILIFYRFENDTVEILRVLHGSRDLESLLENN